MEIEIIEYIQKSALPNFNDDIMILTLTTGENIEIGKNDVLDSRFNALFIKNVNAKNYTQVIPLDKIFKIEYRSK